MKYLLNEYNSKKQELNSGINVVPILDYLENLYGYEKMLEIIKPLGLDIEFLKNRRNWVSYDYYSLLIKKLVDYTNDENSPIKISLSLKPKSVFADFYYASFATVLLGSPKMVYKIIFNKNIYSRYQKIGDFKILSLKNNSATIEYKLKKGYKQNKYNCLAIQGYLTLGTVSCGLPPAKVIHEKCAANDNESCIYIVSWEKKKKFLSYIFSIFLISIIGTELFFYFYNSFFSIKDIILSFFGITTIFLSLKCYEFFSKIKLTEIYNYEKSNSFLESMKKIENDYNEILHTKIQLEERNKFLTVINKINKTITESYHFNLLLNMASKILMENFSLKKAAYFEYNLTKNNYTSIFEMENIFKDNITINQKISYKNLKISNKEMNRLSDFGYIIKSKELKKSNLFKNTKILEYFQLDKNNQIYFIPIIISKIYSGFFILLSDKKLGLSDELIFSLFINIIELLKIGYQKISSRYVIENILSSIPASVLIFDSSTNEIKYINNLFNKTFVNKNNNEKNIIGENLFSILPFDDEAKNNVNKSLKNITIGKISEDFEINLNSNIFEYSLFTIPQYREGERLVGIILRDVTEAKYFQQKLLINEKLVALGRVASGIAHEINNPLYAVLANAEEIAEDDSVNEETREYAEEMIEHVMNVSNIIKDLSTYSKTLRKEKQDEVDLNSIIEESLKLVRYSSNYLEIEVIKELNPLPHIEAAKGEMQQIFINLLNNAVQAMDGSGTLTVTSICKNKKIIIEISDTGQGIKKEVINKIFNLYFTTKIPGKGTGQGLHIVKKIITMYNGDIKVKSKVGEGTTFTITFKVDKNNE